MPSTLDALLKDIRACKHCAAHLPHAPRPIVQAAASARLVIVGQAPGSKVHESGVPWNDASGERLREWTGLDKGTFYDPRKVALTPMGFCYPGAGEGADLPPRPECAPLWHAPLLSHLLQLRLTLLVGLHAQRYYLGRKAAAGMTAIVRDSARFAPNVFPLPHPSWRSTGWMRRNPWFESEVLPMLRMRVLIALES